MRKIISLLALVVALVAALVSSGMLVVTALWPSLLGSTGMKVDDQPARAVLPAFALLGLAYAIILGVAAWNAYRGRPAAPLRLAHWGVLALLTLVTLAAGQYVVGRHFAPLVPSVHVLAGLLPALVILSLTAGVTARRQRPLQRSVGASLAWGGLGGAGLAMALETGAMLVLGLLVYLWLEATNPGIGERIMTWAAGQLGNGTGTPDLGPLLNLTSSPILVLALFALFGGIAPLIEEFTKALSIPFVVASGRDLSRLDGFLLGVAAGAGFATVEAVGYGLAGLAAPTSWAVVMLLRGGTAAIHCLASGLTGLGWQAILSEGKWGRGLGFGLLGLALHSAWNIGAGLQLMISVRSISGGVSGPGAAQMIGVVAIAGGMLMIVAGAVIALPLIAAHLSRTTPEAAVAPMTVVEGEE